MKYTIEYEVAERYTVDIEAATPAAAMAQWRAGLSEPNAGLFIEVDSRVLHVSAGA